MSMSWFGIPSSDIQGAGADASYGNWCVEVLLRCARNCCRVFNPGKCGISNNANACAAFGTAGQQRNIASKRRPLAGIYSAVRLFSMRMHILFLSLTVGAGRGRSCASAADAFDSASTLRQRRSNRRLGSATKQRAVFQQM